MNWIKMNDRKPTKADLPLWTFDPECDSDGIWLWRVEVPCDEPYWMPSTLPAPPPKEKTQKELDEEAFNVCWETFPVKIRDGGNAQRTAFMAALKWEREQVGAMLKDVEDTTGVYTNSPHFRAVHALRKRCGL